MPRRKTRFKRKARKPFKKAVKSVLYNALETKHYNLLTPPVNLGAGWSSLQIVNSIDQSVTQEGRTGNLVWLRNLHTKIRLEVHDDATASQTIRMLLLWAKEPITATDLPGSTAGNMVLMVNYDKAYVLYDKVVTVNKKGYPGSIKYLTFFRRLNRRSQYKDNLLSTPTQGFLYWCYFTNDVGANKMEIEFNHQMSFKDI